MCPNVPPVNQYPFLAGGGTMGELIRNFSWKATSIGDPMNWPCALKVSVGMMLRSPFPMHIGWGEEYIQFYNDAYRPILGTHKHPSSLGVALRLSFPEVWGAVAPMLDGVMEGNPIRIQDFTLSLERSGFTEECHFDVSYSPLLNEYGTICGVLTNVLETTEKVKAFAELESTQEKLRASQAQLVDERDRLMEFFMDSPAGICFLAGDELVFEMVNPLYQQLFPSRKLLGKTVLEAIPELLNDPIIEILNDVMATGKTYRGADELIPLSQVEGGEIEDHYFDLTYQARLDGMGKPNGVLVFAIEVTQRKLEEIRKNDFIGIVSHELKTPITSLQGIVQLAERRLQKSNVDDGFLLELIDKATGQIKRMTGMINSFLTVSRLESGQIHLEKVLLNFTDLVIEAMEELQLSSSAHDLVMECRDVHEVFADKEKITSVVTNLMANAVKYTPKGGRIEMDCSCDSGELVFSVKDKGLGIASDDLKQIFERYYRVSGRQTKNISGFGIGLYISAEIVRLHGGRIWAESELHEGSVFYFSLPLNS